jgi:hypothetical protein
VVLLSIKNRKSKIANCIISPTCSQRCRISGNKHAFQGRLFNTSSLNDWLTHDANESMAHVFERQGEPPKSFSLKLANSDSIPSSHISESFESQE